MEQDFSTENPGVGAPDRQQKITIIVNEVPKHVSAESLTASEIRELAGKQDDYEVWKTVKAPDPEGQLPKDDILVVGSIEIKSGDRFRVVPPGTFGLIAVPDAISLAVDQLRELGLDASVVLVGTMTAVIIGGYPLPKGWSKPTSQLLIKVPQSYPNGKPDMFWTNVDLTLADGTIPEKADRVEMINGKQWRRFSWHPSKWNPGTDDLTTFLQFINQRLALKR